MIREHQYRSDQRDGLCEYKWHLAPCNRPREDHEEVDYKTKAEDQAMSKTRKALIVYIDLADEPGVMSTESLVIDNVQRVLNENLEHYRPAVVLAPPTMQMPEGPGVTKV